MSLPTFFIAPAANTRVRDPQTGQKLPAEGAAKPKSAYWLRRLRDGDVVVKDPPKSDTAPAALNPKKGDSK